MKKIYKTLIISLLTQITFGQSVTIDPNATGNVINAKSTTKGILIPQMTTSQKMAIVSPTEGMMVYDLDVKQFSYCLSPLVPLVNCTWINFGNTQIPSSGWVQDVNDVRNTNSGNIGIGTNSPSQKLEVNGGIRAKGLFMPIKYIPKGMDYTVQDGDYTLIVDGNAGCIAEMYITLPNPSFNIGRIMNISMINYINFCNHINSVYFKDNSGNYLPQLDIYDDLNHRRSNITLQATGNIGTGEWVITGDNFH